MQHRTQREHPERPPADPPVEPPPTPADEPPEPAGPPEPAEPPEPLPAASHPALLTGSTGGPRLVLVGSIPPAVQILVDVTSLGSAAPVRVQLTAAYTITRPPGYPSRPSMTGCRALGLDYPRTVASGTIMAVLAAEATALVAAGGATYL